MIVLFDIDGVLADSKNNPIGSGVKLLSAFSRENIYFVTARPEVRRTETEMSLDNISRKAGITFSKHQLYMRQNDDKRRDSAVKTDLVEQIIKEKEDDLFDWEDKTYMLVDDTYENIRAVRRKFPQVSGLFFNQSEDKKKERTAYFV